MASSDSGTIRFEWMRDKVNRHCLQSCRTLFFRGLKTAWAARPQVVLSNYNPENAESQQGVLRALGRASWSTFRLLFFPQCKRHIHIVLVVWMTCAHGGISKCSLPAECDDNVISSWFSKCNAAFCNRGAHPSFSLTWSEWNGAIRKIVGQTCGICYG